MKPMSLEDQVSDLRHQVAMLQASRNTRPCMKLFALESSELYAKEIAEHLNLDLSPLIERYHADGEVYVRPGCNVRRCGIFVIASLYGDDNESVNDKLAKAKYLVGALIDASASEVTLVAPYLCYARSDRKVRSREPVITKYLAREFAAVGVDRLITIDTHSLQAYQNANHKIRTDNLESRILFANYFGEQLSKESPNRIGCLSPDKGGVDRVEAFRSALEYRIGKGIALAYYDKRRDKKDSTQIVGESIIGEVRPISIICDDMIGTAGTVRSAADTLIKAGTEFVYLVATHGLFVDPAKERLMMDYPHQIVIADTIPPFRLGTKQLKRTHVVSTTGLFAEAIRRTYTGESLSSLFEE